MVLPCIFVKDCQLRTRNAIRSLCNIPVCGPDGKTWENFYAVVLGFDSRSRSFLCHCSPSSSFCGCSLSVPREKGCVLSTERVSLACCTLVPQHRWPQGAWQLPPLGNHRKQLCLKSSAWRRAQSNLSCCLSHLSEGSCNENKQLSRVPLHSLGNNENKHEAGKEPFLGCVSLFPIATLSPVYPGTGSTWPQQSARCYWPHKEVSAKGPP